MKKLRLFALAAASTALIPAALAQPAPGTNRHHGASTLGGHHRVGNMGASARAGHSWREGGAHMQMRRNGPPQIHHRGPRMDGRHMSGHVKPGGHHRGKTFHHGGKRFTHRINRGGTVSHHWFGPRFHVRNWGVYGFPDPFAGGRWIRYYDDALLIDQYGRVHDGRYGLDWDRYGEPWEYGEDGIPVYADEGDYESDERDYEWAEDRDREDYRAEDGDYERRGYAYPDPGHPGYGAYGYGACNCGTYGWVPVLMTETTVTTAPVVESVTRYEHVRTKVRPAIRSKDRPAVRHKYK